MKFQKPCIADDGQIVLILEGALSGSMIVEYLASEIKSHIQGMRKLHGLKYKDKIRLAIDPDIGPVMSACLKHRDYIMGETQAISMDQLWIGMDLSSATYREYALDEGGIKIALWEASSSTERMGLI